MHVQNTILDSNIQVQLDSVKQYYYYDNNIMEYNAININLSYCNSYNSNNNNYYY